MAAKTDAASTQNALDLMTAQIMGRKANAAVKLTAVSGEVQATHTQRMPNDVGVFMSNETLHEHAKALRKFAADAIAIADGIDKMLAADLDPSTDEKPVDLAAEKKKREREADAAALERAAIQTEGGDQAEFDQRLAELQADAEKATFKEPDAIAIGTAEDQGEDIVGWLCPIHDKFEVRKSRGGREYRGCPDCNEHAPLGA